MENKIKLFEDIFGVILLVYKFGWIQFFTI